MVRSLGVSLSGLIMVQYVFLYWPVDGRKMWVNGAVRYCKTTTQKSVPLRAIKNIQSKRSVRTVVFRMTNAQQ